MDKSGKSRHSVWLSDEVWQEVDAFYKLDNCPTRNEFVEKALRQYCGRLHAERTSAYAEIQLAVYAGKAVITHIWVGGNG